MQAGLSVISGGAEGIDGAAHRGALQANGATLVVAPAGWERPYPPQHGELFEQIVSRGGGYLSENAPDVPATQASFFPRNACLVALAHAVVVVEAGYRSGARNAAKHARRLGRKLFAVPAAPWSTTGRGCLVELRNGASLLESAKDVLDHLAQAHVHALGAQLTLAYEERRPPPGVGKRTRPKSSAAATHPGSLGRCTTGEEGSLGQAALEVLGALRGGARHADAVCEATGLAPSDVQRQLFELRLHGYVGMDPSGALALLRP